MCVCGIQRLVIRMAVDQWLLERRRSIQEEAKASTNRMNGQSSAIMRSAVALSPWSARLPSLYNTYPLTFALQLSAEHASAV
jgi:hypothetical protein